MNEVPPTSRELQSGLFKRATYAFMAFFILLLFCPRGICATVTQMFSQALKQYQAGNQRGAAKMLLEIVKKYPSHEPSHLILGRIHYRQGKMARAAYHFRKVSPDLVDGEAAYEYGITFFSRGQCKLAEAGLKRVGTRFRGATLAAFYRGVCFARNREWFRAEIQLEKAVPLPEHLISIRRRILSEVRAAQRQDEITRQKEAIEQLTSPQRLSPSPPPSEYAFSEKEAKARGVKTAPKADTPPAPSPASVTPELTFGISTNESDFNGSKTSYTDSNSVGMGAKLNLEEQFAKAASGEKPTAGLELSFNYRIDESQGKTTVTKAYTDSPQDSFDETTSTPKTAQHTLRSLFSPKISYPILKAVDLKASAKFESITIQEDAPPSGQRYGGAASLGVETGPLSLSVAGDYTHFNISDKKDPTLPGHNRIKGSLTPAYNWSNGFFIEGTGAYTSYGQFEPRPAGLTTIEDVNGGPNSTTFDGSSMEFSGASGKKFEQAKIKISVKQTGFTANAADKPLGGPNSIFKFDGSLELNLEMGASFTVGAANEEYSDYRASVAAPTKAALQDTAEAPPPVVIAATGSQTSIRAEAKFSPIDGLSAKIGLGSSTIALIAADPQFTEPLLDQTPTSSTTISFEISYNKTF